VKIALDQAMLNTRPVEATLRAASEAGYAYVELGNRDDTIGAFKEVRATPADLSLIRRAAAGSNLEIASVAVIQAWSSPDEEARTRAVEWWRQGIAAAVALGCSRINTELCGDPNRPTQCRAAFFRSIEALLPVLEREGIDVVAEPHPGDFLETTTDAIDLVRMVGSARVRYLHCVPHSYYLGGTVTSQVESARGWFDHVHVADTYRPARTILNPPGSLTRIHQHFDIGDGELDWGEVAGALRMVGFDGILTVQVFGWDERAEQSFRLNRAAVTRLFGEAVRTGPDESVRST
jgi:myo-inositol catabolism protein IolH